MISCAEKAHHGGRNSAHATGEGHSARTALYRIHGAFCRLTGRIAETRVYVATLCNEPWNEFMECGNHEMIIELSP